MPEGKSQTAPIEKKLTLTRVFDAPRELVWKAWTEPKRIARWWGPHGFTNPKCTMDVRPGGKLRILMMGPEGVAYPMEGTFDEVKPPERLVFTAIPVDDKGNALMRSVTTVTFEAQGDKTKLTVQAHAIGLAPIAAQMIAGMEPGWSQSLERLDNLVTPHEGRELVITRVLNYPRELVWRAYTEPEHLIHWWGPKGFRNTFHHIHVKPGGTWKFIMHGADGTDYDNFITFDEIVKPEYITWAHGVKPYEPPEFYSTITFEAQGAGKTKLTLRLLCKTVEQCEGLKGFATEGGNSTLTRLEEYLATM